MSLEDIQVMWTWPVHRFSEVNMEGKWQQGTKLSSMMSLACLTWEYFIQLCCGKQLVSAAEWADASDLKKLQLNNFRVVDMEDFNGNNCIFSSEESRKTLIDASRLFHVDFVSSLCQN